MDSFSTVTSKIVYFVLKYLLIFRLSSIHLSLETIRRKLSQSSISVSFSINRSAFSFSKGKYFPRPLERRNIRV